MIPSGVTPRARASAFLDKEWDAIVVGSGIGGLMCAALLGTRARMRVLVLERHHEIGGLTQTFRRRRYAWEVGVHYVGDVGTGMPKRMIDVACGGRITWAPLPSAHDRLIAPGVDARFGGDRKTLRAQWLALARGEEKAADRILDAILECSKAAPGYLLSRMKAGVQPSQRSAFLTWSDRTAADVIAECGASPLLSLLATYAWTDYGSPPDEASFAALAITTGHYLDGAFHPVGGGAVLAREMAATIDAARGHVVVCAEVARAIVREGRVEGVMLSDGAEVRAPIVISDVGARGTFEWLVTDEEARARMHAIGPSGTHVGLYLGLPRSPIECGLDGANIFVRRDAPGDEKRDWIQWCDDPSGDPSELYVSTACAIDPSYSERFPHRCALTIASPISPASFAHWESTRHAHHGEEYEAKKRALGESMLRVVRRHMPQLGEIEHFEVSTPLSTRHFSNHPSAEIYGLAPTPLRYRQGPGPHTTTRGLYLTGQDIWTGGVVGASFGALLCACAITKRDLLSELALR